jgi:tRNA pseudouridine55 synthase
MATGLLTVFVGRATRAVEFAEPDAKRYRAALRPGLTTDTQDITGTVLRREEADVTRAELERVLERFCGEIRQVPPMYSAVRVNGERLYRLARRGETVERAERTVTIHSLELLGREGEDWLLDVRCSKGTYIRTLCQDIGEALGCGGCMAALRRTEAGRFTVNDAHSLEEIARAAAEGGAERLLLPTDTLFGDAPAVTVFAAAEKKVRNGNAFPLPGPDSDLRLYAETGEFLALARRAGGECRIIKSFFEVSTT